MDPAPAVDTSAPLASPGDGHGQGLAVAGLIIRIVAIVIALAVII